MFLDGLDELDQRIVKLLIQNARMSYSEIGQQIGISRVAVKMRVQALEQRGVIEEYTTIINPQKISGAVSCYFEIETRPDALMEVADRLKENEVVTQIYRVTGKSRLHVHAVASSNEEMEKLSSRYSGNTLIEETKKNVNYPGNSDYNTGMSFRMDVYQRDNAELNNLKFQAESEQGAWLTENCWRFGIIFRFPTANFPKGWEDKSYKTGVSAQLNLYRYVGKAHSAAMRVLDMCLEEYIEFLIAHPHICIYEDGALKYEIVRIKIADDAQSVQLPVPNPASSYLASLDNMGGVVMAYTY